MNGLAQPVALPEQNAQAAPMVTVRAKLLKPVDSRTLRAGDAFYLQTDAAWQQSGCTLAAHTTIEGVVAALDAGTEHGKKTQLGLRFSPVACADREGLERLPVLVAMHAADPQQSDGLKRMETAEQESRQISNLFYDSTAAAAAGHGPDHVTNTTANSAYAFSAVGFGSAMPEPELKTGEVRGIRGVTMLLPGQQPDSGPDAAGQTGSATTLVAAKRVTLETGTVFSLLFVRVSQAQEEDQAGAQAARRDAALGSAMSSAIATTGAPGTGAGGAGSKTGPMLAAAARQAAAAARTAPLPEEAEVCAAGGCRQAVETVAGAGPGESQGKRQGSGQARGQGTVTWRAGLAALGYTQRLQQQITALDTSTGVHFLGDDQVLFTFPLHALVARTHQQLLSGLRPRIVRAVVLASSDGRVLRERDWMVPEASGPYVWGMGGGRVLAHVGEDLVVYGPDLVEQHRFPLPGPLLFVSVSPSGGLILAATVHERHTPEQHAKLAVFLGPGVPVAEDYDLTGLRGDLQVMGTQRMAQEPMQPALLQTAMVSARQVAVHGLVGGGNVHWALEENPWGGPSKTLARVGSGCDLAVTALASDMLFTQGCEPEKDEMGWYRVLNPDGATLLKGRLQPFELLQQASSDRAGSLLAVAVTQFSKRVALSESIAAGAFGPLAVRVYALHTGREVFAVRLDGSSDLSETVALAPAGARLAVLTAGALQMYTLGSTPEGSTPGLSGRAGNERVR